MILWLQLALCLGVIGIAGWHLSRSGDIIAEKTGLRFLGRADPVRSPGWVAASFRRLQSFAGASGNERGTGACRHLHTTHRRDLPAVDARCVSIRAAHGH